MDLGSESVEENEVNHDGIENGIKSDEKLGLGFDGNFGGNTDQEGIVDVGSEEGVNSKETPKKGVGLKKWKRIKRNVVRDPNSSGDLSKVLKRGLSGSGNPNLSGNLRDVKEKNDGSSNMNEFGNVIFSDVIRGSSSDSRYAVGSGFVVGTDSDNSEDRSSKSSTAASEPKVRHEKSRSRNINSNSKNFANSVQSGKGRIESSKKHVEGGRVNKIEKENSLSSMESDSRSSFKQGGFSVTSNGNGGDLRVYDHGANSGEANTNEHFTEEIEAGYGNESIGEDEDIPPENSAANPSWDGPEAKSENNQSIKVEDPLIESIRSLQAVQEALEEEVKKFREIGIEVVSPDDDDSAKCSSASAGITAVDLALHNACLSGHSGAEEIKQDASNSLELQVMSLTQNVNNLESKLEGLQSMLALKNSRIVELETALSSGKSPKEESASTSEDKCKDVEFELEDLFRQKIEAEVEYLAITKMTRSLKSGADLQLTLLEEQEKLSENQEQVLNKVAHAESKASALKNKVEVLEKNRGDSLVVEESFVLQKRLCKVGFYLFLQLFLFSLFFWFLVSHLSLSSGDFVPT